MVDEAKLNRFSISLQDFKKAEAFLAEAANHQYGGLIHEALVFSAIICYYRPFTDNEKDPNSTAAKRLDLSDFLPLSHEQKFIHDACKELRNKALAHAEIKHHPTQLDPETGGISSTIFSLVGKAPDLEGLVELIIKFIKQCQNKKSDYAHAIRSAT